MSFDEHTRARKEPVENRMAKGNGDLEKNLQRPLQKDEEPLARRG